MFLWIVKVKIKYGINDKGVMFNISELTEHQIKTINKLIDKSEKAQYESNAIDNNLSLDI